jgi:hypothetical protein
MAPALPQIRRETPRMSSQKRSKDPGKRFEMDKRSPHEAGFGCTPAGADRLHVAGAAISDRGERNTDTERRRKWQSYQSN